MNDLKERSIFVCPKNNCTNIPEIIYTYEPFNPIINIKCNSKTHENKEEKMMLKDFLIKSNKVIKCPICFNIINNNEFLYCKNCKKLFHSSCFYKSACHKQNNYISNNINNLFNICFMHNTNFIFHCLECDISLCLKCDINSHNEKGHTLQQLVSFTKNNKNKDKLISNIKKQRNYFNKIVEMIKKILLYLENDLIIKETILKNYELYSHNYEYIKNFNNLEAENNEKYEKLLYNILNENNEMLKNEKNIITEEVLLNTILSPLYYSLMVNKNQDFNNNLIKLLYNRINKNDLKFGEDAHNLNLKNINNILPKKENLNENLNIKENTKKIDNDHNEDNNNIKDEKEAKGKRKNISNKKKLKSKHKEIKNITQEKSIFNMIVLHTGNIATTSIGIVTIYNSNAICSPNEENYVLQKINICKGKKVSYLFEFPDETLLCSTYSKIFRLRLIDNEKNYNILGIIEFDRFELPTILISLESSFLVAVTELGENCFLKLFIKDKGNKDTKPIYDKNKRKYNHNYENINNNKEYDDNSQNAGILKNSTFYLNKQNIDVDKDFKPYFKNHLINEDKKLFCSVFELKKYNNNKNDNNEYLYEFIATSNSTYELGDDRIEFYVVKKNDKNINVKRVKKITNISCSTETNSICQLNNQYICIGLQNYQKKGQISGFAIINIFEREIKKIIEDSSICSLFYNFEKKILYSAMDIIQANNRHQYVIKIYKIIEENKEINLKDIYELKSEHKDVVISIKELKNNLEKKDNDNNIIIACASIDSTLKLNKILDLVN